MITEAERFNIHHPDLCPCLRWKGMFIDAAPDPSIPNSRDVLYWCSQTQTCLGPDGPVADQQSCCDGRRCYEPW